MGDNGIKLASNAQAGQRCVSDKGETLAGVVVDYRQNPEPPSVGEGVADEVQAPALIGTVGDEYGASCSQGALAPPPSFADLELLLAIQPPELFDVHLDTLALQHHVDAPIAEPTSFCRYCLHGFPQIPVMGTNALVAYARSTNLKSITRPPLAHAVQDAGMGHRLPLRVGRHHFLLQPP